MLTSSIDRVFRWIKTKTATVNERHLRKLEWRFISRIRTADNSLNFPLARKWKQRKYHLANCFFNSHFASMWTKIGTLNEHGCTCAQNDFYIQTPMLAEIWLIGWVSEIVLKVPPTAQWVIWRQGRDWEPRTTDWRSWGSDLGPQAGYKESGVHTSDPV